MTLIGRDAELLRVESLLDDIGGGARAVVLHGEAGIGKSTIWQAAVESATRRGRRVLIARPTESEARFPFAALNDLFGDLADAGAPTLPPPQRAALDVALMRAAPDSEPPPPLALSLAVLELLRQASADGPIVLAIDDVQWLDESSVAVLRFALRRLENEPVLVMATQRTGAGQTADLITDLPARRVTRIPVLPMGANAIDRLLETTLGLKAAPSMLRRVQAMSGGNPFHAVEIGRAVLARGIDSSSTHVPLPESLAGLVSERLRALSLDARAVAAHAAAMSQPTAAALEAMLGRERARSGLAAARSAGLLAGEDDGIRFTHPLLAREAYAAMTEDERRELHRGLAAVVAEPEEVARHLALGATGPDRDVAAALDVAAAHALRRGAPDAAAELSLLAANLTPEDETTRGRRLADAGRHRLMAGDAARAGALLERALEEPVASRGLVRAEILYRLAGVRQLSGDFIAAADLGGEALTHAVDDIGLTIRIKLLLAGVAFITARDWTDGERHVTEAMEMAEQLADRALIAAGIGAYATWRYATGHGFDPDLIRKADEVEPWTRHSRVLDLPEWDFASIELMEGETASSFARLRRLADRAEEGGDYSSLPFVLGNLALGDFLDGRADLARERLERALRLSETTDQRTAQAHVLVCDARLRARLGDVEAARASGREALRLMDETKWRAGEWLLRPELGLLELSLGDASAAFEHVAGAVGPAENDAERSRWGRATAIEALVALGRHHEARATLDLLDGELERHGSPRLRADAQRARARLLAATGDLTGAEAAIAEAEAIHRRMGDRWELGRTQLVAAEVHRRARRRSRAAAALHEARDAFDSLGARLWSQQAHDQIERIGAARGDGRLTPTQREVADLVAHGMTNREVAARLFMSAHTVEAHLTEIYRSLGIRSRGALGAALAAEAGSVRDTNDGLASEN